MRSSPDPSTPRARPAYRAAGYQVEQRGQAPRSQSPLILLQETLGQARKPVRFSEGCDERAAGRSHAPRVALLRRIGLCAAARAAAAIPETASAIAGNSRWQ